MRKQSIIYLTDKQKEQIKKLAKVRTISMSAVIRQIIEDYFKLKAKGV